jgi:hypothetical protein
VGHHEQLRPHRAVQEHLARSRGARHLRGPVRHRHAVAAIPAAGAYNILSGQVARYAQQLESFAGEFITILSRQLEEQV